MAAMYEQAIHEIVMRDVVMSRQFEEAMKVFSPSTSPTWPGPTSPEEERLLQGLQYAPLKHEAPVFKAMPPAGPPLRSASSPTPTWTVWGEGFGAAATLGGESAAGTSDVRTATGGGILGATYRFSRTDWIGVSIAGSQSAFSTSEQPSSGRLNAAQ